MPKNIKSFRFVSGTNGYITDIGQDLSVSSRFVVPPDISEANADLIVAAVGGTVNTVSAPCSDSGLGDLRKLTFIRESGNTMSIAVPIAANIITAATTIKGILDAVAGNKVVCIKLSGEYFAHLNDELGLNFNAGDVAPTHKAPSTAKKQNFLSGSIAYTSDVSGAILVPVRSITEKTTEDPAAQLETEWQSCTGGLQDVTGCGNGRKNPRKHRRYIVDFATKADITDTTETAQTESIEVPVSSNVASSIKSCGENLAALTGAFCIGYRGESYDRIHKLLA